MVEIGTEIGGIICISSKKNSNFYYKVVSAPITKIEITKNGIRYYAPKEFHPIQSKEIEENTKWMLEVKEMFPYVPFLCVCDLKRRAENWCKTHNSPKEDVNE